MQKPKLNNQTKDSASNAPRLRASKSTFRSTRTNPGCYTNKWHKKPQLVGQLKLEAVLVERIKRIIEVAQSEVESKLKDSEGDAEICWEQRWPQEFRDNIKQRKTSVVASAEYLCFQHIQLSKSIVPRIPRQQRWDDRAGKSLQLKDLEAGPLSSIAVQGLRWITCLRNFRHLG